MRREHAVAALVSGNVEEYQSVCRLALDRISRVPPTLGEARVTVHFCWFGPLPPDDAARAIALAKRLANHWPENERTARGREMTSLALLLMRSGETDQAMELFDEITDLLGREAHEVTLGMVYCLAISGDLEQARELMAELPREGYRNIQPNQWTRSLLDHLYAEIDALLEGD